MKAHFELLMTYFESCRVLPVDFLYSVFDSSYSRNVQRVSPQKVNLWSPHAPVMRKLSTKRHRAKVGQLKYLSRSLLERID